MLMQEGIVDGRLHMFLGGPPDLAIAQMQQRS